MAATTIHGTTTVTIDLDHPGPASSHRLAELVQVLTGCRPDVAELAIDDPLPAGPAPADDALAIVAAALLRVRRSALTDERPAARAGS